MNDIYFYSREQVDNYLKAIRDGKIDVKDVLDEHRPIYDYKHYDNALGLEKINPYYLTPFVAYDCHIEVGTCVAVIRPNNYNSSYIGTR